MSYLLHEAVENGKRAEKILDVLKDAKIVLGAYIETCEKYAPKDNDIFPMLAKRAEESVRQLKHLLRNPV